VDAQAAELRRIERDLHDGAQARLTALAMDLGMARARLTSAPESAAVLLDEAHAEAKRALTELRDLARGIHPAVLSDRGLDAAIAALAGGTSPTIDVVVDTGGRLPAAVEGAAYFVVAECLANARKHGRADTVRVRVARSRGTLGVEVHDDGVGGADPHGGGLDGLRRRVEALDGSLSVVSAPSRGTTVRAEFPCES
jgi:signal transduction histidine kinase